MKKRFGILAIAALLSSGAYAASIDHIQTYTPEYLGNQSQNGMINKSSVLIPAPEVPSRLCQPESE